MLRIFRKTRLKSLFNSKIGKYTLYGIGEIFLVVLGILIALQINNWKQNQDNRSLEKDLLERFVGDLDKDILELGRLKTENDLYAEEIQSIIEGLGSRTMSKEDFVKWNALFMGFETFTVHNSTYNAAISTGDIGLLLNKNLRDRILEYYAQPQILADKLMENLMLNQMISTWNEKSAYTKEYVETAGAFNNSYEPLELDRYYDDNEYKSVIAQKLGLLNFQIMHWQIRADEIDGMKRDIHEDLNKRWNL